MAFGDLKVTGGDLLESAGTYLMLHFLVCVCSDRLLLGSHLEDHICLSKKSQLGALVWAGITANGHGSRMEWNEDG